VSQKCRILLSVTILSWISGPVTEKKRERGAAGQKFIITVRKGGWGKRRLRKSIIHWASVGKKMGRKGLKKKNLRKTNRQGKKKCPVSILNAREAGVRQGEGRKAKWGFSLMVLQGSNHETLNLVKRGEKRRLPMITKRNQTQKKKRCRYLIFRPIKVEKRGRKREAARYRGSVGHKGPLREAALQRDKIKFTQTGSQSPSGNANKRERLLSHPESG